jgi:transcription elongation factor Elf1
LITGDTPFVIKPVSMKFRALGSAWDDFIFRCLEEDPSKRFPDAAAALEEYRRIYRPQPAAGEFRAECPECGAKSSVPGGWAGERYACAGCGLTLEVLFYDEATRHASTAVVGDAGTGVQFLDDDPAPPDVVITEDVRARKFCPSCGQSIYAEAKKCRHCNAWVDEMARRIVDDRQKRRQEDRQTAALARRSFALPAVATLLAYFLFWVPGALLNWYYLSEARRVKRLTRVEPAGLDALTVMMWVLVYVPLTAAGAALCLVMFGALIATLVA